MEMENKSKVACLKIGDTATMKRTIKEADVLNMAEISGDYNPIHTDEEYAKSTRFGKRIAHGLFVISMVSALLGNELPGLGTVIATESMKFLRPVYFNDTITASVTVENIFFEKNRVSLSFRCVNQDDLPVMNGSVDVIVT